MGKFFITLIIFQLIVAPYAFSFTETPPSPPSPESAVPSTRGKATEGDKLRGTKADEEDHKFDSAKLLDPHYMIENMLEKHNLVIALSTTGVTFDLRCPAGLRFPSVWVYKTASLIHYGYEFFAANALTQNHNRKAKDLEMLEEKLTAAHGGGELQRESLMMARDEEQETLRYIQEKKKWLNGIMVAQLVATGLALVETINDLGTLGSGTLVGGYIGSVYGALAGAEVGALVGGLMCTTNPLPPLGLAGLLVANFGLLKKDPRYQKFGVFLAANVTGISVLSPIIYDWALPRSIAFGANAYLVKGVVDDLTEQEKVTKSNIEKLTGILANLGPAKGNDGVGTGGGQGGGGLAPPGNYQDEGKRWYGTHGPRHCWSSGGESGASYSTDCKSPMRVGQPQFDAQKDLPYLSDMTNLVGNTGQAVSDGDLAKGSALAAELGSSAARVKALNEELKDKINSMLKAKGKSEIDFDKEEKNMLAQIRKEAAAAGAPNYQPPANAYKAALDPAAPKGGQEKGDSKGALGSAPAAGTGGSPFKGMGMGTATSYSEKGIIAANAKDSDYTSAGENIADFETSESDIISDKSVSIFKVITHRYALSYERLMNRKRKD